MRANFPLGMALAVFLAIVIAGCGDQVNNPVAQEQDQSDLGDYRPRGELRIGSSDRLAAQNPGSRNDPYLNFKFRVEIDGILQAGFSEVILPGSTLSISVQGGEVSVTYSNLILKWGITDSMELYNWFAKVADGALVLKNLSVILIDEKGMDVVRWNFINALPVRYDAPDLDAMGNDVAVETLEIAFERMVRVN